MGSFELLKREIREYIYDKQWPSLTKIQEASIKYISETQNNIVLAAPTASGKTEAAFLPAINSIEAWDDGLKIIYISPLIALINDQFKRVNELCQYLNINVTSWHGEASQSGKKKLLKNPNGIVLITPESVEAMLCFRASEAKLLFEQVQWILLDEIHSFLDNNRGIQLSSLLERMQSYIKQSPRYIGMSATLHSSDYQKVKELFKNDRKTNILVDKAKNDLYITKEYFEANQKQESDDAIEAIYNYSQKESMLVFPNSRKDVEYLSVKLIKKGKQRNSYTKYFAHHSSISKELRLQAENFAKTNSYELYTICATSTLEMGMDIGSVDSIVQYNAPNSVSSLAQRLGRSGRKTKENILHFIATNQWDLLQGLAAISLFEQGIIDKLNYINKPYDVFAHQIISMLLERAGIPLAEFQTLNKKFLTWKNISDEDFKILIQHLLQKGYIELWEQEIISGITSEKLLKRGEFFSQFVLENNFSVYYNSKKIGEIPLTSGISIGENIFLAAKVWKIIDIEMFNNKIFVSKAVDGKPPKFIAGASNTSNEIRNQMKEILIDTSKWDEYDENIKLTFKKILSQNIEPFNVHWINTPNGIGFRSFAGSIINKTLEILLNILYNESIFYLDDKQTLLYSKAFDIDIKSAIKKVKKVKWDTKDISNYLEQNPMELYKYINNIKYKNLLPSKLQIKYVVENIFDIDGALKFLKEFNEI